MEIRELLQCLKKNTLDFNTTVDLLGVYIGLENKNHISTLLKLFLSGELTLEGTEGILTKLKPETTSNKNIPQKTDKTRKNRRAARPLEVDEYKKIITLSRNGFLYTDENNIEHVFRPNPTLAMTFILQTNLGLRISDVLKLKPSTFKNDKLEVIEKKTGKLQYRSINKDLKELIYEYALDNNIKTNDYLITVKVRAIQKQLAIIVNYLGLSNISTHSFRKLFGVTVYNNTNGNIELLKELFNHGDISTTQRYIKVSQREIDEVSSSINFL